MERAGTCSRSLTATDAIGTVTQYGYDSFGNNISVRRDAGGGNNFNQRTAMAYNAVGDLTAITDPNGKVTTSTYDAVRRLTKTTTPPTAAAFAGVVTALSYDADGRVLQARQSANGAVLRTVSTSLHPDRQARDRNRCQGQRGALWGYDALDRLASVTDPMWRVTRYGYDALSRRTTVSNPVIQAAPLLQQSYTANGQLASLTGANGNATSFAYDGFDRLATSTYPGGSTETFSYDAYDNMLTRKTRANGTISLAYDRKCLVRDSGATA
jgi:YD repeat-containing protein